MVLLHSEIQLGFVIQVFTPQQVRSTVWIEGVCLCLCVRVCALVTTAVWRQIYADFMLHSNNILETGMAAVVIQSKCDFTLLVFCTSDQ